MAATKIFLRRLEKVTFTHMKEYWPHLRMSLKFLTAGSLEILMQWSFQYTYIVS